MPPSSSSSLTYLQHQYCWISFYSTLTPLAMDNFYHVLFCVLMISAAFGNPIRATNKLSLATWGSYYQRDHKGPGTYAFGYDIEDPVTGNIQFKQEERHPNGTITGTYGYVDADGKPFVVTYVSDENGYRAKIEKDGEPVQNYPDGSGFSRNDFERRKMAAHEYRYTVNQQLPNYLGNEIAVVSLGESDNLSVKDTQSEEVYNPVSLYYQLTDPKPVKYGGLRGGVVPG